MDEYLPGSQARRVAKGMFWAWHQEAWAKTATDRQIRSAWAKAGLWPLSAGIILGKVNDPLTHPPQASQPAPPSPRTPLGPRRINTALRNGELDPVVAVAHAKTAAEVAKSESVLLRKELEEARAAMGLDKATRGGGKAVQNPGGGGGDDNREALEKREEKEEENRGFWAKRAPHRPAGAQSNEQQACL
ncbi:hypothetical protein L198_06623 [Cryptococcus wingfieldii CBS 7118]|uniref:Uncharacterized protein n=1 Tax=Cryptococcus wingfieldii CBS 7118 TaxID=1295528 RepID=A0A1E3IM89_9TREE|nr:hypothetical protein L198_06623 [Cryptococcus wingfieldii CBS 7118]ODN88821.1 hypothetical protein L198_06623 [Cryptococcus wingfieldii CBS 7118]